MENEAGEENVSSELNNTMRYHEIVAEAELQTLLRRQKAREPTSHKTLTSREKLKKALDVMGVDCVDIDPTLGSIKSV